MSSFTYPSGDQVCAGDQILYHEQPGQVEFVITAKTGDPVLDWYLDEYPGGGFMIRAEGFGPVFLTENDVDEDLQLISRRIP
jgi:hypothetical protein